MDTRHMRYFVALAETLHFGQAAARMNMSQPPFSRQIAAIEKTLGVTLFERTSRYVALTAAGKHFLRDCRTVLAGFDLACRDVQRVANGMTGELRLGFMMHAATRIVPALVRQFAEARPDVKLMLEEHIPTEIDEMLVAGTLDAAVTFGNAHAPHLKQQLLARDRLCLIARNDHRLAAKAVITPEDLDAERLIATPLTVAPALRSAISTYCATGGVVPNFAYEPRLQHTIIRLVSEGLGISLVPQSLQAELGLNVIARPLNKAPEFDVVLCAPLASKNPAMPVLFAVAERHASDGATD